MTPDPRAIADLLLTAPGMSRAANEMSVADQAALMLAGKAVWDAAVAAERDRCAKPVPDEWLVKVRRLVEGFEHVSGLARLWEPDYSSGSERALWASATEACADVAKLLNEAKKA